MINLRGWINIFYYGPIWFWILFLVIVFLVLLTFKIFSGNWIGRKSNLDKSHLSGKSKYSK